MHLSKLSYRKLQGLIIIGMLLASVFITLLNIRPVLGADWWNTDWPIRKQITIDYTRVDADLSNFPVLIDITDGDLISKVQDDGGDIAFTDYSGTQLNHEIEFYNSSTGQLVAWVSLPSLLSTTDTFLYMYYGNAGASNQENVSGVWNSNYVMVQHLDKCGFNCENYTARPIEQSGDSVPDWTSVSKEPFVFGDHPCVNNPVLTAADVTDVSASFVADPFLFFENDTWYMFFEVQPTSGYGEIGLASSSDGVNWAYEEILVDEPWHLSYPQVFKWDDSFYMLIEASTNDNTMLYETANFPYNWTYVNTLISGQDMCDASIFYYNNTWWMFGFDHHHDDPATESLELYYSDNLTDLNSWTRHPESPVATGLDKSRPGGRPVVFDDDRIIRYTQKCDVSYGENVRAFEIDTLTKTGYSEHEVDESPVIWGDGSGWNADGMHNIDPWYTTDNRWFAVVDGVSGGTWSIGIYASSGHFCQPYGVTMDAIGKINGAVELDGVDDYVGCGSSDMPTTAGTIEAWIRPSGGWGPMPEPTDDEVIVEIGLDGTDRAILYLNDNGKIRMLLARDGTIKIAESMSSSWSEQWYHIVGTWDGTSTLLYVDGSQDGSDAGWSISTPTTVAIGRTSLQGMPPPPPEPTNYFNGTIDEVRISNIARSADWVSTEYNNQHGPSTFYTVEGEESILEAPSLSNEYPRDGATDVRVDPTLSITATDYQGENMTIIFKTNTTGTWQDIGIYTNAGNGVYNVTTTNMNSYGTKYWWGVNATDPTGSGNWTTKTLSFTTRPENYAPTVSNPSPPDGATGVSIYPSQLSFNLVDLDGDSMDYSVVASPDIGSDSDSDVYNGAYKVSVRGLKYNATYTWHVNVTDGIAWTNKTYTFTTREEFQITHKWTRNLGGTVAGVRVADLNGDGVKDEVIKPHAGGVTALRGTTGTTIWSYSDSQVNAGSTTEVADLNNDGIPEILVTIDGGQAGLLALHGNNGSLYWKRTGLGGIMGPSPIIFDIDQDGYPTIFWATRQPGQAYLSALTYDGVITHQTPIYWCCAGGLSLMDYDNDGHFELYMGDNHPDSFDRIRSYWAENLTMRWESWRTSPPIPDGSANLQQLIDVTGDGIRDVVVVTRNWDGGWYGGRTGVCVMSAEDGTILRLSDLELSSVLSTAICDIDHDGNPEVIGCGYYNDNNNYLTVFDLVDWVKEVEIPLTTGSRQQPAVGDVTGDGYMDILVPDGNNLRIFNRTYHEIAVIGLEGSGGEDDPYIQVFDLDGEGLNEIVANRQSGHVIVFDTDGLSPPGGVRTETKHYSEYRLGASEYVTFIALKDEQPSRSSINVPLNPTLSIDVYNYQGETLTVTFSTNASETWEVIGTYTGGNGIYSQPTTNMNSPNTTYWWSANVTDGYTWNKVTYKFKTTETPQTTIQVYPTTTEAVLNSDYTIYVNVTNVIDLYAWEFQLDYDPTILDLTSCSIVSGGLNEPTQTFYSLTNEISGHLWWAVSTRHPTMTGISYAKHAIFEIHFHTIAAGTSILGLYGTFLSDSNKNSISHTVVNGSITVTGAIDLTVTNVNIVDHGCSIYADDTYVNGTAYYYPVEVTVHNAGTEAAGPFYTKLEVFWINGSLSEASAEILVSGLTGGQNIVVNFTSVFHPMHTGHYRLTATADSQDDVTETNETNNVLIQSNIPVTVMGDVNGDGEVNILDGVIISLAWAATPLDPRWNICADVNHDGVIDILDGVRVALHWSKTW